MTKKNQETRPQEMRDAFADMMKVIPEDAVRAVEIERVTNEYMDELRCRAEDQLRLRCEPITEDAVDLEMSNLNRTDSQAVARDYSEGVFSQKPHAVEDEQKQGESSQ